MGVSPLNAGVSLLSLTDPSIRTALMAIPQTPKYPFPKPVKGSSKVQRTAPTTFHKARNTIIKPFNSKKIKES
jgi:hypothetical protein